MVLIFSIILELFGFLPRRERWGCVDVSDADASTTAEDAEEEGGGAAAVAVAIDSSPPPLIILINSCLVFLPRFLGAVVAEFSFDILN